MQPVLRDGDTIVVPSVTKRVGIAGRVAKPGLYGMPRGETLCVRELLALAGGIQGRTNLGEIRILRRSATGEMSFIPAKGEVLLQSGDVVYVPSVAKPTTGKISGLQPYLLNK